tara:strand:+ start:180 stop:341 length:162 start_codon:yes stop_codon:yes gene_type:complete
METLILVLVITITLLLGRYAIKEGQRIERDKKFKRNFINFKTKINNKNEKESN